MFAIHSWRRSYALVVIATLTVVAGADFLIYGRTLGWSCALVAATMLAALALRDTAFCRTHGGRLCALAAAGLLLALVEQPTWLNIAYLLVCASALSIINAQGWEPDFWPWMKRLMRWLLVGWAQLFLDNGLVMRFLMRRGLSPRRARGVAAWIVPLLLASVFVALFAWANPVISDGFSRLADFLTDLFHRLPDLFNLPRMTFWLAFATLAWMLMRGRLSRTRRKEIEEGSYAEVLDDDEDRHAHAGGIPAGFAVRCLILFNLVFAVENILDVRYLGDPASLPRGMSYTEYVHRGAYPLIAAALLAGAFVLITFRPDSRTESSRAARRLVYLWIGQTIFLTLSAAWRLKVYVALSELTRLRVASAIWFMLVAIGLFYIIWRIVQHRSNRWLVNINAITALLVLYPCCFVNFDGLIADYNVAHCQDVGGGGSKLDVEYLHHLGTPALPALDRAIAKVSLPSWRRDVARSASDELHHQLATDLSDWRSWTWRRSRSATPEDWAVAQTTASSPKPLLAQATPTASRSR